MADKYQKTQLENIVLGMLSASIFFLVLFQILDFGLERYKIFVTTALMAITGTLIAALISNVGTRRQIQANYDLEEKRQNAKLMAEKAVLPLALTSICDVCLANLKMHRHENYIDNTEYEKIPSDVIGIFKGCIEAADKQSQVRLSNILNTYQVLMARSREGRILPLKRFDVMEMATLAEINTFRTVINWAMLYALCSQAFDYSRGKTEKIPMYKVNDEVGGALQFAKIFIDDYPELLKIYDSKSQNDSFEIF